MPKKQIKQLRDRAIPLPIRDKIALRFNNSVQKTDGCWEWVKSKTSSGYGRIRVGEKTKLAHRISHELHTENVPDALCVLHSCDNPSCVNPSHLRLGTYRDNAREMSLKGRGLNSRKTHCPQGHEYSEENTLRFPKNPHNRVCKTCHSTYYKRTKTNWPCN